MKTSHIMRTSKILTDLCLQCSSNKNVLTEHKEVCFSINGAQSVKLEKGSIKFKNLFEQI